MKYLLRFFTSIILFLLFIGLAKMNRSTDAYISFLNTNDWSVFHLSQPATWVDPFWPNTQTTGDISDGLGADTIDAELSGLDVNEAAFEDEFTDGSLSGDEDF